MQPFFDLGTAVVDLLEERLDTATRSTPTVS